MEAYLFGLPDGFFTGMLIICDPSLGSFSAPSEFKLTDTDYSDLLDF
jgi:hypothetical protein